MILPVTRCGLHYTTKLESRGRWLTKKEDWMYFCDAVNRTVVTIVAVWYRAVAPHHLLCQSLIHTQLIYIYI